MADRTGIRVMSVKGLLKLAARRDSPPSPSKGMNMPQFLHYVSVLRPSGNIVV
jgi:hypothetical protein